MKVINIITLLVVIALGINTGQAFFPGDLSNITSTDQGHLFQVWNGSNSQVSVTCDVNGDGIADLLEGRVLGTYVFFGQSSYSTLYTSLASIDGTNGFLINGLSRSVNLNCGDVNNDGFDDILINDMYPYEGRLYIVYGKASGWSSSLNLPTLLGGNDIVAFNGVAGSAQAFGYAPSAGDINGDGLLDLVFGCSIGSVSGTVPPGSDNVYVIYGINGGTFPHINGFFNLSTLDGTKGFLVGSMKAAYTTTGDLNNDGLDDIIVNKNQVNIYIIYGSRSIVPSADGKYYPLYDGNDGFIITTSNSIDNNLQKLFGIGDFNGDGFNDISFYGRGSSGQTMIYSFMMMFGPFSGPNIQFTTDLNSTNSIVIIGTSSSLCNSHYLKDINGDGLADIQCSVYQTPVVFFTIFGRYELFTPPTPGINIITYPEFQDPCKGFYTNGTASYNTIGDMNGDGVDDLLLQKNQQYYYAIYGVDYYNVSLPEEKNITVYQESSITQLFNSSNLINGTYDVINNGQCSYKFIKLKILNPVVGDTLTFNNPNTTQYGVSKNSTSTEITIYLSDLGNGTDSLILSALQYVYITPIDINENKTVLLLINNVVRQPIYFNVLSSLIPRPTVQPTSTPTSTPTPTPTSPTDTPIPTNQPDQEDGGKSKSKSKVGVIVGPIVGCAALLAAILALILLRKRIIKKKKHVKPKIEEDTSVNMTKIYAGGKIQEIEQF